MAIDWSSALELYLQYLLTFGVVGSDVIFKLLQNIPIAQPNHLVASIVRHQSLLARDPDLSPSLILHHPFLSHVFHLGLIW